MLNSEFPSDKNWELRIEHWSDLSEILSMWQNRGRTKLISVVVCFCILLLAAVSAAAQDNVSEVSGHVVSSRGNEPLALVEIQIPGTSFRSVTTDDGSFRFTGVPAGQHVLQA